MTEAKKGESFEMIGGNVQGSFVDLVPFTKIIQKWRLKSWPAGYFAHVEINIMFYKNVHRRTLQRLYIVQGQLRPGFRTIK